MGSTADKFSGVANEAVGKLNNYRLTPVGS